MPDLRIDRASRLALGTVQFGLNYGIANKRGQVPREEIASILDHGRMNRILTLDTAIAYGDSEQRLGEIGVSDLQIVSKLPAVPEDCLDIATWVDEVSKLSRERLRVKNLYGLLLHRPQQLVEPGGDILYRALQEQKKRGHVQNIGISIYDPQELELFVDHYEFDIVQAPFNILDNRLIESGWLTRLQNQGVELHVRSVFLQGLLLMTAQSRPRGFSRWQALWECWDSWLEQNGLTPLEACLRYALAFSQIHRVVVGVDTLHQLIEIVEAADERALPVIPREFRVSDPDLLNPSRWSALA